MSCPQCIGIEELFDRKLAAKELRQFQQKGARATTRLLVEKIVAEGVQGLTLLDIGGGVGAVQVELLSAGARSAVDIDASSAYLTAAREEAASRGFDARVSYRHGNFVEIADSLEDADIVTLDRVICCYSDARALVELSARKARRILAFVYPRDTWLTRLISAFLNLVRVAQRSGFRNFVHRRPLIEASVHAGGLERRGRFLRGLWEVAVFVRPGH
ncbi:MAG: methyltransferase domain-containing protein [Spirochaetia bacterium]|jgi:magnesium-protoporphyrin O-methyltransferase